MAHGWIRLQINSRFRGVATIPVEFYHADGSREVFDPSDDTLSFLRSATGEEVPVIRQGDLSDEGASKLYQSLKSEHTASATERVRRNDPRIKSQMGADPGYGMTRAGLREETRHDPGMDLMRANLNTERAGFGARGSVAAASPI